MTKKPSRRGRRRMDDAAALDHMAWLLVGRRGRLSVRHAAILTIREMAVNGQSQAANIDRLRKAYAAQRRQLEERARKRRDAEIESLIAQDLAKLSGHGSVLSEMWRAEVARVSEALEVGENLSLPKIRLLDAIGGHGATYDKLKTALEPSPEVARLLAMLPKNGR